MKQYWYAAVTWSVFGMMVGAFPRPYWWLFGVGFLFNAAIDYMVFKR